VAEADQLSFQLLSVNPLAPHELLEPLLEPSDPVVERDTLDDPLFANEASLKPELLPPCVPLVAIQLPPDPSVQ
jgi:hypothetical protein